MARVSNLKGTGPVRPKGCRNKATLELQEMIQRALLKAGGVKYLETQARENPGAFLTLVAKLLPRDCTSQARWELIFWRRALRLGERACSQRGKHH